MSSDGALNLDPKKKSNIHHKMNKANSLKHFNIFSVSVVLPVTKKYVALCSDCVTFW